ncbi:acyl carrier protein [Elusimicrobiota bacterium]
MIEKKIKEIMSAVFNIHADEIHDGTSTDSVEKWDSLGHMNLMVAIEEEFDIEFLDEDIPNLLNFRLIYLTIKEKLDED